MSASNQFFASLPSLPGGGNNPGGNNPGGFNFSGMPAHNNLDFGGMFNFEMPNYPGFGGSPGGGGTTPPIFNWPGSGGGGGNPYQVPSQGQSPSGFTTPATYSKSTPGYHQLGPMYPGLSNNWAGYLTNQVGQGVSPFDLSTILPTGGSTAPGQLTAGENPLLQSLQQFFTSGGTSGGLPGMSTLANIAQNGVSAVPAWQSMVAAQQQGIQQNEANLREQFGSMGNLAGSPFGTAMSNYAQQTTKDQNALLGQLQLQGILQGQLPAAESLSQSGMGLSNTLQNLNQQAIQNQYGEFVRTSPQYNPMNQYMTGMSQFFPELYKTQSGSGALGGLLSNLGPLMGIGGSIAEGLSGGGGITDVLSSLAGLAAA